MTESAIPDLANGVAARTAQRTLAKREADYASEVRRLLDAALEVIRRSGTVSRARVADIVAAAGLSNDALELDASLAAHAAVGKISDYLWQRAAPAQAEIDQIAEFCLRAITPRPSDSTQRTDQ